MPSPEREGFGLFILHKLVDQIHNVDFKFSCSVRIGFSVISDSLNQFFFCVPHNFNYFDNAKVIIFWLLHKYFNTKNHQKIII